MRSIKLQEFPAKVSLKDKEAIISYDRELSNIELRKAVEDAGYEVISLS